MPTPKQVRYHWRRLKRAHDRMQEVLNDAHNAEVINYEAGQYETLAPCSSHWETWKRVKKTTEAQLAQAMRQEIEHE